MVGVFVAKGADGVRVAVTGAGDERRVPLQARSRRRWPAASTPSALDGVTVPADELMSDMHASAEYRANLIVVMAKRAVARANG